MVEASAISRLPSRFPARMQESEDPATERLPRPGPGRNHPGDPDLTIPNSASSPTTDAATRPGGSLPSWVQRAHDEAAPLRRLRSYELGPLLGQGGMGMVYLAWDAILGREVAVKLILGSDPDLVARMLREARAQSRVEHPNVCRILEAGEWEGRPYVVMPLVRGRTLDALAPKLSVEELVRIFADVCEGLHEAHRLGLVHRDIKPHNVMVEATEAGAWRPYLMDFGLVRDDSEPQMTATGLIMGTPAFMSPEQARGDGRMLDRRADVYSLGASLYLCLAGRAPFEGAPMDVVLKVLSEEPPALRSLKPGLPKDLETIVQRAMEKEPERRYPTARALGEDLHRYLDGEPLEARALSRWGRLRRWSRRNPRLALACGLALLLGAGLVAQGAVSALRLRRQARIVLHFGLEAERLESLLRTATLRPFHDTTPERQAVLQRIRILEADMRARGDLATGPGHFALGKAHAALGDPRAARSHLQAAWDAGFRTPEVSHHLGRALAEVYQLELQGLAGKAREKAVQTLEASHRRPAIQHLQRGQDADPAASALALGLLAQLEEKPGEALRQAARARSLTLWNDSGWRLEGAVRLDQARIAYQADDYGTAQADVAQAIEAYRKASEIAPSSALAYTGLAQAWRQALNIEIETARPRASTLDSGIRACEQAISLDPEAAQPRTALGLLLLRWADPQANRNPAFRPPARLQALDRAIGVLQDAARRDPGPETLSNLAWAHGLKVLILVQEKEDARASLGELQTYADRTLGLQPDNARAIKWLSVAQAAAADMMMKQGLDPLASLRASVALLERAWANAPTPEVAEALKLDHLSVANLESDHQRDPRPALALAWKAMQSLARLDPRRASEPEDCAGALIALRGWYTRPGAPAGDAVVASLRADSRGWLQALDAADPVLGKVLRADQDALACRLLGDGPGTRRAEAERARALERLEPGLRAKAKVVLGIASR